MHLVLLIFRGRFLAAAPREEVQRAVISIFGSDGLAERAVCFVDVLDELACLVAVLIDLFAYLLHRPIREVDLFLKRLLSIRESLTMSSSKRSLTFFLIFDLFWLRVSSPGLCSESLKSSHSESVMWKCFAIEK